MTADISIIVASYNHGEFLSSTLRSIEAQSLTDWRALVVDDGSQDDSVNIIRACCEQDRRFELYQHAAAQNRGLSESLQLALRHVSTEWTAFCESDDWWEPSFLQQLQQRSMECADCGVIFTDVLIEGPSESMEAHCEIIRDHFRHGGHAPALYRRLHNAIPTMSCAMARTELLRNCDFNPRFPPSLDMWLWAQLATKTGFAFVDQRLCHWRQHDASYMKRELNPDKLDHSAVNAFFSQIRKLHPNREGRGLLHRLRSAFERRRST